MLLSSFFPLFFSFTIIEQFWKKINTFQYQYYLQDHRQFLWRVNLTHNLGEKVTDCYDFKSQWNIENSEITQKWCSFSCQIISQNYEIVFNNIMKLFWTNTSSCILRVWNSIWYKYNFTGALRNFDLQQIVVIWSQRWQNHETCAMHSIELSATGSLRMRRRKIDRKKETNSSFQIKSKICSNDEKTQWWSIDRSIPKIVHINPCGKKALHLKLNSVNCECKNWEFAHKTYSTWFIQMHIIFIHCNVNISWMWVLHPLCTNSHIHTQPKLGDVYAIMLNANANTQTSWSVGLCRRMYAESKCKHINHQTLKRSTTLFIWKCLSQLWLERIKSSESINCWWESSNLFVLKQISVKWQKIQLVNQAPVRVIKKFSIPTRWSR